MPEGRGPRIGIAAGLVAGSVIAGIAVAVGGPFAVVTAVALAAVVLAALRPLETAVVLATAPYIYNIGRIELFGAVNIRVLQVLWLAVAIGLLLRAAVGQRLGALRLPSPVIAAATVFLGWEFVAAFVSGAGFRPFVESVQTGYLLVVGMIVAMVFSKVSAGEWAPIATRAAVIFVVLSIVSLVGYFFPGLAVPYYVIRLGPGVSVQTITAVVEPSAYGIARFSMMNVGPVGTAAVLVPAIALALACVLASPRGRGLAIAVLALAGAGLLLTLSRAGWLVSVSSSVWLAARSGARRLVPALASLALLLALLVSVPAISGRLDDVLNPSEGSNRSHLRLYATALYMANSRPVFGWGPGRFTEVAEQLGVRGDLGVTLGQADTHNFILQEAAEAGWGGAALEILLVGVVLWACAKELRGAPIPYVGLFAASCALLAMGLTMNIFKTEVLWSLLGVTLGASLGRARAVLADPDEEAADR